MGAGTANRVRGPLTAAHLRSLVRNSPVPVLLVRLQEPRVVEASDSFLAFVGRDRASLVGAVVTDLTDQPQAAIKSLALLASGVIDGYTRHASFRRPSGENVECDIRITACSDDGRRHALASVLPMNWARSATSLQMAADDATLIMGTVNGQWMVDRITTGDHPELAFMSRELLHNSAFVAIHPEDVGELLFIAAQASRQRGGAFGRLRLRSSSGGWVERRLGLQPLGDSPSAGYAFILFSGRGPGDASAAGDVEAVDVEDVAETTVASIRASAVAGWMVSFPTALQLPELSTLTPREYEILLRLAAGERVRQIARSLHLGESTVRNHLTSIVRKTGVGSQHELLDLLRERA
jgi:DNA-binding CsgD family transcriptional regulator